MSHILKILSGQHGCNFLLVCARRKNGPKTFSDVINDFSGTVCLPSLRDNYTLIFVKIAHDVTVYYAHLPDSDSKLEKEKNTFKNSGSRVLESFYSLFST